MFCVSHPHTGVLYKIRFCYFQTSKACTFLDFQDDSRIQHSNFGLKASCSILEIWDLKCHIILEINKFKTMKHLFKMNRNSQDTKFCIFVAPTVSMQYTIHGVFMNLTKTLVG